MITLPTKNLRVRDHLFLDLPIVIFAGLIAIELLSPGFSNRFPGWSLLLSLFLVGMPHGAVDFSVNARLRQAQSLTRRLATFSGHLTITFGTLLLFLWNPTIAILCFLIVSGVHFGLRDARATERRERVESPSSTNVVAAAARGCLLLGLAFFVVVTVPHHLLVERIHRTADQAIRTDPGGLSTNVQGTATSRHF